MVQSTTHGAFLQSTLRLFSLFALGVSVLITVHVPSRGDNPAAASEVGEADKNSDNQVDAKDLIFFLQGWRPGEVSFSEVLEVARAWQHSASDTATFTATSEPTGTLTSSPTALSPTATCTPTESITVEWTPTPGETPTASETPDQTLTPTRTSTLSEIPAPCCTPTHTFFCTQAAQIKLVCAGETSLDAVPFYIRLYAMTDATSCGPANYWGALSIPGKVDPALEADYRPFDETPFSCTAAQRRLTNRLADQLNGSSYLIATTKDQPPGEIYLQSSAPFFCCVTSEEIGISYEDQTGWPIDTCGLGNLGDGIDGNETVFSESDFSGLSSGFGVICLAVECPSPTPTLTRIPSRTPTPSWPYSATETVTIQIPGMPEVARPLRIVRVTSGSFHMGNTREPRDQSCNCSNCTCELPRHMVTFRYDFYMSETEITQAQWKAVMGSNPAKGYGVGNDYPVHSITWTQCQSFISRLNELGLGTFRLPSESEWEYACRGSASNPNKYAPFPFGDDLAVEDHWSCQYSGLFDQYMWWCGNSGGASHPVASKLPNDLGLYDMEGNVREWCQDYSHEDYSGAPTDGSAWMENPDPWFGHVVRGGGWDYFAYTSRSAYRGGDELPVSRNSTGFRIVLTAFP